MERKKLTKDFLREGVNKLYRERLKLNYKKLTKRFIGLIIFACSLYYYLANRKGVTLLDRYELFSYIFLTLLLGLLLPGCVYALVSIFMNHLFPKKRCVFMQEFSSYNSKVTGLVNSVLKNAEESLLKRREDTEFFFKEITKIEDEYEGIDDVYFDGERLGVSLVWDYLNNLNNLFDKLKGVGIESINLNQITIENLTKNGVRIKDEAVFTEIVKIIELRNQATKCRKLLIKHVDERRLLQDEIDEYIATNTGRKLSFVKN